MKKRRILSMLLAIAMLISLVLPSDTAVQAATTDDLPYELETVSATEAGEYSYWKVTKIKNEQVTIGGSSVWRQKAYIQNTKTGCYLTNNNGTVGLSTTNTTTNEEWGIFQRYQVFFICSMYDDSYMTLYNGTLSLLSSEEFSYAGIQSIVALNQEGTKVGADFRVGTAEAKLYCGGHSTADGFYLNVAIKAGVGTVELITIKGIANTTEYSDWEFVGPFTNTSKDTPVTSSWYKKGYIQNTKTGWYLTNNDGTLGLSATQGTNEEWEILRYNNFLWISSVVDGKYINVYNGKLTLGTQTAFTDSKYGMVVCDAQGTDKGYDFRNTDGTVARLACKYNGATNGTFLTADLESIYYQTRTNDSGNTDIRLVSYVDDLTQYSKVTFQLKLGEQTSNGMECTTAYSALKAEGITYVTEALIGVEGYFVTHTITNADSLIGREVTIIATYTLQDGTTVVNERTVTFSNE